LKKLSLALLLAVIIACVSMLIYRGRDDSGDELSYFDASTSWVRFGDFGFDESLWRSFPNLLLPTDALPIQELAASERAFSRLISPLVWLADHLPQVGVLHGVWLANVLVAIALGVLFFALALRLGYSEGVAFGVALATCLFTSLTSYSKTLFREPMVAFFLLLSVYAVYRARASRQWFWGAVWASIAVLGTYSAYLIKDSAFLALPALALLAIPHIPRLAQSRGLVRVYQALLVCAFVFTVLMAYSTPFHNIINDILAPILRLLNAKTAFSQEALHAYLFSVGGSLWGTSPILLLGFVGAWYWRKTRPRLLWVIVLMVLGYTFGHAYLTGEHWSAGLSWLPRFLVPIVPLLGLLLLPVFKRIVQVRPRFLIAITLILGVYSAWINVVASISFLQTYTLFYPEGAPRVWGWSEGLNSLSYLRWLLLPQTWGSVGYDLAWYRAGLPLWAWSNGVLFLVALGCAYWVMRHQTLPKRALLGVVTLLLVVLVVNGAGLVSLHDVDPEHQATDASLHQALALLDEMAKEGDVLLLPDLRASDFVLNELRGAKVRPLVLGDQWGETYNAVDEPQIRSESVPDLLIWGAMRSVDHLALQQRRVFLLATLSDYETWAVRPVERYLNLQYAVVQQWTMQDNRTRLLEYAMVGQLPSRTFSLPEVRLEARFGDHIRLHGVTLPNGTRYAPDDTLAIAFSWSADATVTDDMVMTWFINPTGNTAPPVQAMDARPQNGFASTLLWKPYERVWDRRGLRLPSGLPAGEYEVWVLMYRFVDGAPQRLTVSAQEGMTVLEESVLVLPITLVIE